MCSINTTTKENLTRMQKNIEFIRNIQLLDRATHFRKHFRTNVTHSDNECRPLFYSIPFTHVRLVEQISMVLIWPSAYCDISGKMNYTFLDNLNFFSYLK